jgi:hypothetical protein
MGEWDYHIHSYGLDESPMPFPTSITSKICLIPNHVNPLTCEKAPCTGLPCLSNVQAGNSGPLLSANKHIHWLHAEFHGLTCRIFALTSNRNYHPIRNPIEKSSITVGSSTKDSKSYQEHSRTIQSHIGIYSYRCLLYIHIYIHTYIYIYIYTHIIFEKKSQHLMPHGQVLLPWGESA